MRHFKDNRKLSRSSSHVRCLMANMLKSLIIKERIQTTLPKAKLLRRYAERMVTLAKKNTLASRRQAIGQMMVTFNQLTSKEARSAKKGNDNVFNDDRKVIAKLFDVLGLRFSDRNGGYTRIIKSDNRVGDNASTCIIEYLAE
ncbi:MAG TPA: 50S ribosomal protein L17 [Waddliaceae bacterium]